MVTAGRRSRVELLDFTLTGGPRWVASTDVVYFSAERAVANAPIREWGWGGHRGEAVSGGSWRLHAT